MPNITITDRDGDELCLRAQGENVLLEIEGDDDDTNYFVFKPEQRAQVVKMRDFLNTVLGDQAVESDAVHAASIPINEAIMRLAALHRRMVKFRYAKGNGNVIETRKLVPQEIQSVKGNTIFVGQDPDRDDEYRAYRVDRMKGEVVIV